VKSAQYGESPLKHTPWKSSYQAQVAQHLVMVGLLSLASAAKIILKRSKYMNFAFPTLLYGITKLNCPAPFLFFPKVALPASDHRHGVDGGSLINFFHRHSEPPALIIWDQSKKHNLSLMVKQFVYITQPHARPPSSKRRSWGSKLGV